MVNITDSSVPTGTYSFRNVKHGKVIRVVDGQEELTSGDANAASGDNSDKWVVAMTKSKKVTIRNGKSAAFAAPLPGYGAGDPTYSQGEVFEWAISKVPGQTDAYLIYYLTKPQLLWSFPTPDGNVEFARRGRVDQPETWWNIQKEADIPGFGGDGINMGPLPTLIPDAKRPANKDVAANHVEFTVPQGWSVTITALALGNAINSFYLQAVTKGSTTVDTFQFYNERSDVKKPMKLKDQEEMAYQAAASAGPIALGLTCYSSTNSAKKDPFVLSQVKGNESTLRLEYIDKTVDVRNFPDYRMYYVMSLDGETGTNAVITVLIAKTEGDLTRPPPPPPGTNPGTNPDCDKPRPDCMDEYLKSYDSVFLVDDSGSMEGSRWEEARLSLVEVANEAMRFDTDGIGLLFFNSQAKNDNVKGEDVLLSVFNTVRPQGGTPTGARLDAVLGAYITKLDGLVGTPGYETVKLLDLIVVTDGEPTDKPLPVLEKWAAHLKAKKHHPNTVGVQFVQVGNVASATQALTQLVNGNVNGMVDTVPYNGTFTPERLVRVLLGGIMPTMRAKQQAGSGP